MNRRGYSSLLTTCTEEWTEAAVRLACLMEGCCCWLIMRCLRKPRTKSSGFGWRNSSTAGCHACSGCCRNCLTASVGGLPFTSFSVGGLSLGGLNWPISGATAVLVIGTCCELDVDLSNPSAAVLFCQHLTQTRSQRQADHLMPPLGHALTNVHIDARQF